MLGSKEYKKRWFSLSGKVKHADQKLQTFNCGNPLNSSLCIECQCKMLGLMLTYKETPSSTSIKGALDLQKARIDLEACEESKFATCKRIACY